MKLTTAALFACAAVLVGTSLFPASFESVASKKPFTSHRTPGPTYTALTASVAVSSAGPANGLAGSASGAAGAPSKAPGPPAPYYASYGLIAIVGLAAMSSIGMFLFQAPGFRRAQK